MPDLSPTWRSRLAKTLALLESPHDGERLAAATAAARMVREAGATWEAILAPPAMPPFVIVREAGRPAASARYSSQQLLSMTRILKRWPGLSTAETTFLADAYRRLYREPHLGLDAGMVDALAALWRRHMTRTAA